MVSLRVVPAVTLLLLLQLTSSWLWSGCDASLVIQQPFNNKYSVTSLTLPPGLPSLRGLAFMYNDSNTLLIGSQAYSLTVYRASGSHTITGFFPGASSAYGNYTPASSTSLKFAPWKKGQHPAALLYSQLPPTGQQNQSYQAGSISQLTSPYTLPNVVTSQLLPAVTAGEQRRIVSLGFTPAYYNNRGALVVVDNSLGMTQVPYTVDQDSGTLIFNVAKNVAYPTLLSQVVDFSYTPSSSPFFENHTMVAAQSYGALTGYGCDEYGRLSVYSNTEFAVGTAHSLAFDPVTADLLVTTDDPGVLYLISGFTKPAKR